MLLLIIGMIIFLAVHLIPTFVAFRQKLITWKGEAFYKIGYSCGALIGLILHLHPYLFGVSAIP